MFPSFSGDLLIIMAQIIVSVQMVYEERVINRRNIHPLAAVGWEGRVGGATLEKWFSSFSTRPQGCKTFLMLNSYENETYIAH